MNETPNEVYIASQLSCSRDSPQGVQDFLRRQMIANILFKLFQVLILRVYIQQSKKVYGENYMYGIVSCQVQHNICGLKERIHGDESRALLT